MSASAKPAGLPSPNPSKSFWHSEPSPLLSGHRSTRKLPERADVVVVGSGITGASVAWHLLGGSGDDDSKSELQNESNDESANGLEVVMLEAREACWGATGRNGGHCQPILFEHPHDASIGYFELANLQAISTLCSKLEIECEFHTQQGVRALYSADDVAAAKASLEILVGTDAVLAKHMRFVTDKNELKQLRIPTASGAVVTDVAARIWPYKLVSTILERLLTSNALPGKFNLQTHTAVSGLEAKDGTWEVVTPRGSILAKKVVLATNAYTSYLLNDYADLIVPVRGQMSALLPPPQLSGENRLQTSFGFLGPAQDDYLIQREKKERGGGSEQLLFGGGRSEDGLNMGVTDDDVINEKTAKYLRSALNTLLGVDAKAPELRATHEWTGIMGFSRDSRPFVGPVPSHPGVFISAGYTGHGMPNAWLCGAGVAKMVKKAVAGSSEEEFITAAVQDGLPKSYLADGERVAKARKGETVEVQDQLSGFKAEYMD